MANLYQIYGTDAHSMTVALMEAADVASMIPAGASVALKPNLVTAGTPESGATTHPGVLSGCLSYLKDHGFQKLSIIEGSWVGANTNHAYRSCGYDAVCKKYNVPFYDLKRDTVQKVKTPLRTMEICTRALDTGFLINLPVLKGHCQTIMTCALKNCKGCIPDREKRRFHSEGLIRPIAALASALKPDLTIVDSICGDLNFEEGGNPIPTNRMILGTDPVQVDAYGCQLMGLELSDVPYIRLAEEWGAGSTEIGEVITLNEPQSSAVYPAPSDLVRKLTRRVKADSACSACYASLVRALYRAGEPRCDIAIGQSWRGKSFEGVGIGNCCKNASAFCPGCPPSAAQVADFLRENT